MTASRREDVSIAKAERRALMDAWLRKRLVLQAECEYGNEKYTAEEMQRVVWLMCADDPVFFFNYFLLTVDPREKPEDQIMPFILYDYQAEFIRWFCKTVDDATGTIDRENILIEKSRDMGLSWLMTGISVWYWLFKRANILWGSRTENEVDKKGDLDTSIERCRFLIRRLPKWLLPEKIQDTQRLEEHLGWLLLRNPNGGQIAGESANPEFSRGGRYLFVVFDEFPVWEHADSSWKAAAQSTNIRIAIGTPKGPFGKFAELANSTDPNREQVEKRRLHWRLHPIKAACISKDANGAWTSPWYEEQKRTMTPEDIASELDISYARSVRGLVFPDYTDDHRVVGEPLEPVEKSPILRVWDPGLTFCVLFLQIDHYRRVLALREFILDNARIADVAEEVIRISTEEFPNQTQFIDCGDPAGAKRVSASQADPEYIVLAEQYSIDVDYSFMEEMPAQLRVKNRIVAIHNKLREYVYQTKSMGLLIDIARCPKLDEALREKYMYKTSKFSKQITEQIDEQHPYEDVVDCLGYGILYKLGLATTQSKDVPFGIEKTQVNWKQIRSR